MSNQFKKVVYRNETNFFEEDNGYVEIRTRERGTHLAYYDPTNAYISNPGMGIQGYAYSDHMHIGYTAEEWSATESTAPKEWDLNVFKKMIELKEIDNVYIRVEWKDIQKEKGKLFLPPSWEALMEAVQEKGTRWSFRIMNSSPHGTSKSSVPEFLENKLKMISYYHGFNFGGYPDPKLYPAYTEEYFKWWGEMLHLLGDKYDNSPFLEFGDVSGFGMWGEGHHGVRLTPEDSFHNYQVHTPEEMDRAVGKLIDAHLEAFPKTPAVISMHLTEYESGLKALREGKLWLRRDSFMSNFSTIETQNVLEVGSGNGMVWETIMPGCVYPTNGQVPESHFLRLPQRWADMGCHYGAVGFNPWDAVHTKEHYPAIYSELQNKIGYRLRPAIIFRKSMDNGPEEIVIGMKNDGGIAPPGIVTIHAELPDSKVCSVSLPEGKPAPGPMELYRISLPDNISEWGPESLLKLSLGLKIKGKSHKVRWAVSENGTAGPEQLEIPLYRISQRH